MVVFDVMFDIQALLDWKTLMVAIVVQKKF